MSRDLVDRVIAQWRHERPDLDVRPMATFARLGRLGALLGRTIEEKLGEHGLSTAEFDVLASLRRAGSPHRLTPSQLSSTLLLSGGAMTNRLDRLEAKGLVERVLDREDRRSFQVSLTKKGLATVDAAVADHVANEKELLSPLTQGEQADLDRLLKKLLAAHEPGDA
jgi:DNA-binding MarR family transcriptional regulator